MKRSRLKPSKKKASFRGIKAKLDKLCRAYVMARDGGRCRMCGDPDKGGRAGLQWAHIYSRRYLSVRWDPWNSLALCPKCHLEGHHSPLEFAEWVTSQLTQEQRETLRDKLKKPGRVDYEAVALELSGTYQQP